MSAIKVHLEQAEYDAVVRYAEALGVSPEDVAFAALNRLMLTTPKADVNRDILETRAWRRQNLPLWSDSACAVHAYEGKPDDEPEPSRMFE
jgi:hypothetical protein